MEENSPCKKITSQPEGSRKKGRPKLRWLDSVLKDVKILQVEAWWNKALDRNFWGKIIKEAKVHTGLRARRRRRRSFEPICSSSGSTPLKVILI
jgi:hypothetical protein